MSRTRTIESTLYSCLNVKELFAQSRREIWSLGDCNWTRAHNHLVHKWTLNHLAKLAKWLSCVVSTYLYGVFDCMFLDIHAAIECGFTLKRVRDMISTYSQMHRTDKYSQHSSVIWPVWLNGWVFVYELSGCGFESSCSHSLGDALQISLCGSFVAVHWGFCRYRCYLSLTNQPFLSWKSTWTLIINMRWKIF